MLIILIFSSNNYADVIISLAKGNPLLLWHTQSVGILSLIVL